MGTMYMLTCEKCGYEIEGNIGVGFSFPRVYKETMKAARAGVLGKNIKEFLEEYPDGVLNTENTFLQCVDCGSLIIGQNLSMYTRASDASEKEHARWSAAFPYEEEKYVVPWQLKEEGYRFYGYGNLCKKCGKPMKPIEESQLQDFGLGEKKRRKQTSFTCPKCGEFLQVMKTGLWD